MSPLDDAAATAKWDLQYAHKKIKTSDRALIYAHNGNDCYLLIYILDNPGAHETAKMNTQKTKALMKYYAALAEQYITFQVDLNGNPYP